MSREGDEWNAGMLDRNHNIIYYGVLPCMHDQLTKMHTPQIGPGLVKDVLPLRDELGLILMRISGANKQ